MKKLQLVLLFLALAATCRFYNALGQGYQQNPPQININAKGGIYNHDGTKLGYIDKDNIVRNNAGKKVYFIDRDGNVIDANGNKLGKAQKNGTYYNLAGQTVLTAKDIDKEKCAILDPVGHNMGTTHQNYKLHACAAHCLFLEQQKKKAEAAKRRAQQDANVARKKAAAKDAGEEVSSEEDSEDDAAASKENSSKSLPKPNLAKRKSVPSQVSSSEESEGEDHDEFAYEDAMGDDMDLFDPED